jgi:DNA polymerase-3 subunit delta
MGVHLLTGGDESVLRDEVSDLVKRLVGDGDRTLMVDEFEGAEYELRAVAAAAQTPPFLTDKRVVVARDVGRFLAAELGPLTNYLTDPLPTTDLVLVAGGGRLPKQLTEAVVGAGGHKVDTSPPARANDRVTWVRTHAEEAGVRLDGNAAAHVADHLGEDAGRLHGILALLVSTYGEGVRLGVADVEPFLGDTGGVPPWDLTDALDKGNTARALELARRMTRGGDRHPLQVLAILHNHYSRLARLDGADARGEADAAAAIGIKPGFPAKKALDTYRQLGGAPIGRAIELLARADRDLHGETGLDADTVLDVLVARLSRLRTAR